MSRPHGRDAGPNGATAPDAEAWRPREPLRPEVAWEDPLDLVDGGRLPLGMGNGDREIEERLELCRKARSAGLWLLLKCRDRGQILRPMLWDGHESSIQLFPSSLPERSAASSMREVLSGFLGPPADTSEPIASGWDAIRSALDRIAIDHETRIGDRRSPTPRI